MKAGTFVPLGRGSREGVFTPVLPGSLGDPGGGCVWFHGHCHGSGQGGLLTHPPQGIPELPEGPDVSASLKPLLPSPQPHHGLSDKINIQQDP